MNTVTLDSHYLPSRPELVDLFDEFLFDASLPYDDVTVAPEHQPVNSEHEDEVPNQEAVNGIARSKRKTAPAWRDLGLQRLVQQSETEHQELLSMGDRLRDAMQLTQRTHEGQVSGEPARTMR